MIRQTIALTLVLGGCSAFDPNVGPARSDGAAASTCTIGAGGYGASYGSPDGQAATNDFCSADGGTLQSACDTCEAASCCAQRVACYSDKTCSCADSALDPCTTAASGPYGSAAGVAACWSTFAASGAIASARYACLTASCASACQIPN
jgi:hypothetical protein